MSTGIGEAPSLIGREIAGRYRVQAKLGEGGMGAVYKAEQISLKRQVAVKILRPEVASSQLLLRRFNAEAELVAKLSHPNTVNIYDFGQDSDGTLFIAMEYIDGKSLRDVIHQEAPLPLRRALAIASQVAASLVDAHAHSIVHRDLKPDNVMLQDRGRQKDVVRVLDFGIAKLRDENRKSQMAMTQAGDMLGTPQYMSPEQIRGENIDGRTDIYSLGGLLYEMVTGRLPFEAPTVMALLSKHLLETIVPPSQRRPDLNLPPEIDSLILRAMAKDAAARPPTMEQFGEEIANALAMFPSETGGPRTAQATAQSTAQRSAVHTPPAAMPLMTAPTAAAAGPPPQHAFPPVGQTAPVGYTPPYPPPQPSSYNPHAHGHAPPPPLAKPNSGGKGIWVLLGLLVVAGIGTGVYFGVVRKGDASPDKPTNGSDVAGDPPPATPDAAAGASLDAAATGDDPWNKAGGSAEEDGDDDPNLGDDDAAPTPKTTSNMPKECTDLIDMMEQFATCKALPETSRQQMKQAADQMRTTYAGIQLPASAMGQMRDSCRQSRDAMKQSLQQFKCGN
jgi:serine/threonine-protein kinase